MTKKELFYSNLQIKIDEIEIEPFVFEVLPFDSIVKYRIGIGDDCVETTLSDYDNDFDYVRHCLENACIFAGSWDASVRLNFDMSPNTIRMKRCHVFDLNRIPCYMDKMRVEIELNEFQEREKIIGFCEIKQVISTLYFGLLQIANSIPRDADYDTWELDRLVMYNKFKSLIIEDFLNDIDHEKDIQTRQVIVKHILTICPDVNQLMIDEEGVSWETDNDGTILDTYDKDGNLICIPELLSWYKEIEPIVIASETGKEYNKDWADYHKRGLALAQELRRVLTPDFDLWYEAPYEDKSGLIPRPIFITAMGNN